MWDIKKSFIDNIIGQFYHYFYFIIFFVGIFILVLFICYGKKTRKKSTWSWDKIKEAFSSLEGPKTKKIPKKNEQRCRLILERIFHVPFTSIRPDFLKHPVTGKNLELDGYNEQLGLAFEYNGIQHRVYHPRFHKTEEDFIKQQERDHWKRNKCKELGIRLLEIPDTIPYEKLGEFIVEEIRKWDVK